MLKHIWKDLFVTAGLAGLISQYRIAYFGLMVLFRGESSFGRLN